MESNFSFWRFNDVRRRQSDRQEEHSWKLAASKLAFEDQMRLNVDRDWVGDMGNIVSPHEKNWSGDVVKMVYPHEKNFKQVNWSGDVAKTVSPHEKSFKQVKGSKKGGRADDTLKGEGLNHKLGDMKFEDFTQKLSLGGSLNGSVQSSSGSTDKRFKSLPPAETLPRNEMLGGYIFVCNNDTMAEDLKRQLFGLPQRYRDSVRAIQPGLPLFLYNYTAHQLHGVYEAASFGGTNIDPTAWEDKKCKGESRFPAQVRSRVRKLCKPLEEDSFRPVLHHYDGPKFRLQLSVPETLALLDLFTESGSA